MTDDRINLADLRDRQPDFNLAGDTVKWVKEAELLALIDAVEAARELQDYLEIWETPPQFTAALARFDFGGDA